MLLSWILSFNFNLVTFQFTDLETWLNNDVDSFIQSLHMSSYNESVFHAAAVIFPQYSSFQYAMQSPNILGPFLMVMMIRLQMAGTGIPSKVWCINRITLN